MKIFKFGPIDNSRVPYSISPESSPLPEHRTYLIELFADEEEISVAKRLIDQNVRLTAEDAATILVLTSKVNVLTAENQRLQNRLSHVQSVLASLAADVKG